MVNIICKLRIFISICMCKTKVLWVLEFGRVGEWALHFQNFHIQDIFLFLHIKLVFELVIVVQHF